MTDSRIKKFINEEIHPLAAKMKNEAKEAGVVDAKLRQTEPTGDEKYSTFLPKNKFEDCQLAKDIEKLKEDLWRFDDFRTTCGPIIHLTQNFEKCYEAARDQKEFNNYDQMKKNFDEAIGVLDDLKETEAKKGTPPADIQFIETQKQTFKKMYEEKFLAELEGLKKSLKSQHETNYSMVMAHKANLKKLNSLWIRRQDEKANEYKDKLNSAPMVLGQVDPAIATEEMIRRIKAMQEHRQGFIFKREGSHFNIHCEDNGKIRFSPPSGSVGDFKAGIKELINFLKIREKPLESVAISYPPALTKHDIKLSDIEAFIEVAHQSGLKVTEPLDKVVQDAIEMASPERKEKIWKSIRDAATAYDTRMKKLEEKGIDLPPSDSKEKVLEKIEDYIERIQDERGKRKELGELKGSAAESEMKQLNKRLHKIDQSYAELNAFMEDSKVETDPYVKTKMTELVNELKTEVADIETRKNKLMTASEGVAKYVEAEAKVKEASEQKEVKPEVVEKAKAELNALPKPDDAFIKLHKENAFTKLKTDIKNITEKATTLETRLGREAKEDVISHVTPGQST